MLHQTTRLRALALYKELHRLGRDYPDPSYNFHSKLRSLYERNRNLTDPDEIEKALRLAEFIKKGVFDPVVPLAQSIWLSHRNTRTLFVA